MVISRHFYLSPIDIEKLPYWQYELFNIELDHLLKEEKKRQDAEEQKQNAKMPRMPKIPSYKPPKI